MGIAVASVDPLPILDYAEDSAPVPRMGASRRFDQRDAVPRMGVTRRFDLRAVSAWITLATQKNRVFSLTLYVAVPAAKLKEIVNLEAIPRSITGGGNWVALRDSCDSAVERYWGHVR